MMSAYPLFNLRVILKLVSDYCRIGNEYGVRIYRSWQKITFPNLILLNSLLHINTDGGADFNLNLIKPRFSNLVNLD